MSQNLPGAYVGPMYAPALESWVSRGFRRGQVLRVAAECGLGLLHAQLPPLSLAEGLALLTAYWSHLFTPETDLIEAASTTSGEALLSGMLRDAAAAGEIDREVAETLAAKLDAWDSGLRLALVCRLRLALAGLQERARRGRAPMTPREALVAAGIVRGE